MANYPAGVYRGKESITRHLYLNVGGVEMGEVGLGDGRLPCSRRSTRFPIIIRTR